MATLYECTDFDGDLMEIRYGAYVDRATGLDVTGIHFLTVTRGEVTSCMVPDDEIPALISALQDYMSRRAKRIIRDAKGAVPRPEGAPRAEDVIREGREEGWVWE